MARHVNIVMTGVTIFSALIQMAVCCKEASAEPYKTCVPYHTPCKVYLAHLKKNKHITSEPLTTEQTTIGHNYDAMISSDTLSSTVQPSHIPDELEVVRINTPK